MQRTTLRQAKSAYIFIYKKVNGHEPIINNEMTVGELVGHARYWWQVNHENTRAKNNMA